MKFHLSSYKIFVIGCAIAFAASVSSQVVLNKEDDPELSKIDIVEHLGSQVPGDLTFTDDHGRPVHLSDYFNHDKPILLTLAYYRCPMLCNLVLNGVANGVKELEWQPGEKFQMVTVSFDARDSVSVAAAKKQNYLGSIGANVDETGWAFLIGDSLQSKALADMVGFKYFYVPERQEYAHAAVAILLSPEGKIMRYLYGIDFPSQDLKFGLLEASEGRIGTTLEKFILYCFHYDPSAKGYVLFAQNLMKIGGAVTVVILALVVTLM
ncbi:MAG: SCO family protein, partial [Candidatus Zixiibacteriota bacterium]